MDLKELDYIVTVADEGSISRAAEKLFMAQSSLSQAVRLIEQDLGTSVFVRTARGVRPTAAGEAFISHARQILQQYREARSEASDIENLKGGTIIFGISTYRGTYLLPPVLKKFHERYPKVHVEISDRDTFVRKYICQEKRMRVSLPRWRYLPERLAGIILCVGAVEVALLDWLGYGQGLTWQRGTMALGTAAVVLGLALLLEVDSLWEQIHILLLDYVSNTLYPRQIHVYEAFAEETDAANSFAEGIKGQRCEKEKLADGQVNDEAQKTAPKNATTIPLTLKKEEEKLFQEVLSDFLG